MVILCLGATGCVSHQSVETNQEKIRAELEPGDRVEIVLRDGEEISFRVKEVGESELVGDTSTDITLGKVVSVPYSDIQRLERVDQRPLVVIGTVVAVPFVLTFLLLLAIVATW